MPEATAKASRWRYERSEFSIISYIFGFYTINNHKKNAQNYNYVNVVAVQNNEDPWKNGLIEYSKNIRNLKNLTEETFDFYNQIDFVIWPETAVVPPILTYYQGGKDKKRQEVINSIAKILQIESSLIFVKAKTGEKLPPIGTSQAVEAEVVCLLEK